MRTHFERDASKAIFSGTATFLGPVGGFLRPWRRLDAKEYSYGPFPPNSFNLKESKIDGLEILYQSFWLNPTRHWIRSHTHLQLSPWFPYRIFIGFASSFFRHLRAWQPVEGLNSPCAAAMRADAHTHTITARARSADLNIDKCCRLPRCLCCTLDLYSGMGRFDALASNARPTAASHSDAHTRRLRLVAECGSIELAFSTSRAGGSRLSRLSIALN